jgi:hypothetical protein
MQSGCYLLGGGTGKSIAKSAARSYLRCCSWGCHVGVKKGLTHMHCAGGTAALLMDSEFTWQAGQESLRYPAVVEPAALRSGTFKEVHKHAGIAHFVGPKYQEVHQRSPALGATVGSKQPDVLPSSGCRLERCWCQKPKRFSTDLPRLCLATSHHLAGAISGVKRLCALE